MNVLEELLLLPEIKNDESKYNKFVEKYVETFSNNTETSFNEENLENLDYIVNNIPMKLYENTLPSLADKIVTFYTFNNKEISDKIKNDFINILYNIKINERYNFNIYTEKINFY